jgi:hypothetical protein
MYDTDLSREYDAATSLGLSPRNFYEASAAGALCDEQTRERLRRWGDEYEWASAEADKNHRSIERTPWRLPEQEAPTGIEPV